MFGKLTRLSLAALLAGTMATSAFAASDAKVVKIGWAPWSDAEFVTKLAAKLIQDNLDQKVELVQTDVAPLYQGVSRGDLDAMLMAWLPATHADYYKRVEGKVENLGPLYEGAKLGWVVPSSVPESDIKSIEDLKKAEIHEKLKGQIQGIDPGAGLTRLSEEAVKKYGLNYKLQISSEAAMLTTVDRATRSDGWFVATAWSPHWMFGKYKLRYLEDPEGALGAAEHVNALARKGFKEDNPKVASLLEKMNIPLADLEKAMFEAQETSYDKAVDKYIADNPDRIKEWLAE
ncbi:glycine betaine ABC transporter substrate-binding protein [Pseudochrobactrum kiredjianiae]|uniref:Glycine betaine ABC transporter substrate-binding protein n=1 Tax=Pseudochrobactrum kiredjianiae TaxID=386305 RepID=A0ABW3UZ04_9HYPH|nr:glycine betaine ABC transporter substrate-binding protein [Pseudochrobactrum kiredjianiae]MDM7852746.1 glycine betaine ABC transporter substrate-binding protein [Pseudochrobactrum kiredjianiae]